MTRSEAETVVFHLRRLIQETIEMAEIMARPNIDGPSPDVKRHYRRRLEEIETDLVDAIVREP